MHRLLFLLVFAIATSAGAQTTGKRPASFTSEQRQKNLDSFDNVWKTVRDKHYDPKLNGLDWNAVRKEFRPKIVTAKSRKDVRKLLSQMVGRLKQTHFAVIPAEVYDEVSQAKGKGSKNGTTGIDVRIVAGKALVVRVEKASAADKKGVRTGWEIVTVKNRKIAPSLVKVKKTYKKSPRLQLHMARSVLRQLRGKVGEKVPVVFRTGVGKRIPLELTLAKPRGIIFQFGLMPATYVNYRAKKLNGGVAYFHLNTFLSPPYIMPAFEKTVIDNLNAKGFVLDLRGNPGGIGAMAIGFGNWFMKTPNQKLGTMRTRNGNLHFVLNRRPKIFTGPLAVLVDGLTGSTSEILAGGLQDLKRAKIFGRKTAAAALPSVFMRLPNGDGFQYAVANYVSVGGKPLEGLGVKPDVEVPLTRADLLDGRDAVLQAAIDWIAKQSTTIRKNTGGKK